MFDHCDSADTVSPRFGHAHVARRGAAAAPAGREVRRDCRSVRPCYGAMVERPFKSSRGGASCCGDSSRSPSACGAARPHETTSRPSRSYTPRNASLRNAIEMTRSTCLNATRKPSRALPSGPLGPKGPWPKPPRRRPASGSRRARCLKGPSGTSERASFSGRARSCWPSPNGRIRARDLGGVLPIESCGSAALA
jgi:hypothetical protein